MTEQQLDTSPTQPELDDVPEDDDAEPADAGVDNPAPEGDA